MNAVFRLLLLLFTIQCFVMIIAVGKKHKTKRINTETKFDSDSKPGHFTCQQCGRSFKTLEALNQHEKDIKHSASHFHETKKSLSEERTRDTESQRGKLNRAKSIDRDDQIDSNRERRGSISEMEKLEIAIDKEEKKNANAEYSYVMRKIINHIRTKKGGKIYSADIYLAGSNSVKTKVESADEIDTNIKLDIKIKDIHTEGTLKYIYADKKSFDDKRSIPRKMKERREFKDISETPIPHGQVVVKVADSSLLPHLTYKGDLISHKVLQDLHTKVEEAIDHLQLSNVILSPTAQGPAITITIQQRIYKDINIDIVPSLPCSLPVSINGWPRKESRSAFPKKIKNVLNSGLHLVPKGDETWHISYSKAEKALLEGIDDNNEYRRGVMKVLKKFLQTCKDESASKLPGLSSYIVKIQVLWSSERRRIPGYWSEKYKDKILFDVIDDMVQSLESGELPGYFDDSVNILAYKNKSELNSFVNCLKKEKKKIATSLKDEL